MTKEQCDQNGYKWAESASELAPVGQADPTHTTSAVSNWFEEIFKVAIAGLAQTAMSIAALFSTITGALLNFVVQYTIVDVAKNYGNITTIAETWKVLRDLANLAFIFVLLYAGIMTIVGRGGGHQKLIKNIVVAAILMNFSLFLTRLIIDAGNILAVTFYDAIAPGALTGDISSGLSGQFIQYLHLTDLYRVTDQITSGGLITVGIMGTVMLLIAAFSFGAIALLLIIRYVVLLLVLVLSPIFFVSQILPASSIGSQVGKYADQWKNALFGQAFFAPIYFFMTWVALRIMGGVSNSFGAPTKTLGDILIGNAGAAENGDVLTQDMGSIFINFTIVIVLLIAALIVAKNQADRVGTGFNQLTSWAIGKGSGVAGFAGRQTLGRAAQKFSESKVYKSLEANSPNSMAARLTLAATDKTRKGSFDTRGNKVSRTIFGAAAGSGEAAKGGFEGSQNRFREFFEKPGTKSYKERLERSRKAEADIAVNTNAKAAREFDSYAAQIKETEENIKRVGVGTVEQYNKIDELKKAQEGLKAEVYAMESALVKATDKEVEAMVESNPALLKSTEFATRLTGKQLDALVKSDKISDDEKDTLKQTRLKLVTEGIAAKAVPETDRSDTQRVAANALGGLVKGLSDTELEMLVERDPQLLERTDFVSNMRSAQIDTIAKSPKFTKSQQAAIKATRNNMLLDALDTSRKTYKRNDKLVADMITKNLTPKDVGGLMSTNVQFEDYNGNVVQRSILFHPEVIGVYTPKLLKRMAEDLSTADVQALRGRIEELGESDALKTLPDNLKKKVAKLTKWLGEDDGTNNFS